MFRLAALVCFLPLTALAEWSPRPSMFSYEAAFAVCTSSTNAKDRTAECADTLSAAYALKRAVARAAFECRDTPLKDCPLPFEDEGLPAIAVRIAVDAGCDPGLVAVQSDEGPLPADHCVSMASDIMIDEGVVPLITDIRCDNDATECRELATIHATLWIDAADALSKDDPIIDDLQARNMNDCLAGAATAAGLQAELDAMACIADRAAALWSDLAQQD